MNSCLLNIALNDKAFDLTLPNMIASAGKLLLFGLAEFFLFAR